MPTTYPLVPGHEFVGEVSQVGSAVTTFKKGDKVGFGTKRACCGTCQVCLSGDDELCSDVKDDLTYGKYFGGYATQVQQPYDFFFKLPDNFKLNLKYWYKGSALEERCFIRYICETGWNNNHKKCYRCGSEEGYTKKHVLNKCPVFELWRNRTRKKVTKLLQV